MTTNDEPDPFERGRRAMGLTVVDNPYPEFAERRHEHVVVEDLSGLTDDGTPLVVYTAASYDAVFEVLRDGRRFSSAGYAEVMEPVLGRTILQMDEPEHHGYRSLLSHAFRRSAMDRWEAGVVRPVVEAAVDAFAGDGRAELVRQLTFPFPLRVMAGMLDLPAEQAAEFHRLAVDLIAVEVDLEAAGRASAALAEVLLPVVEDRRRSPGDDLISVLAQAEHEG
ncbi:MAG TPA: cytochrome P450, partial [Actinomycetes bacterium]|nr:cytochrome P450 [Actinomycetes bacterium]